MTFFRSKDGLRESVWLEMQILGSRNKGESQGASGKQPLITYHQSLLWLENPFYYVPVDMLDLRANQLQFDKVNIPANIKGLKMLIYHL